SDTTLRDTRTRRALQAIVIRCHATGAFCTNAARRGMPRVTDLRAAEHQPSMQRTCSRDADAGRPRPLCGAVRLTSGGSRLLLSVAMIRRHPGGVLVVSLTIAALAMSGYGCSDNPVGRICDLGTATPET